MPQADKYEKMYQQDRACCGEPFPEIAAFFEEYETPSMDILDLGCGQGRDALLLARRGHRVLGVDISITGIQQMMDVAKAEALDVRGIVMDIANYKIEQMYDAIILDRVLHMLPPLVQTRILEQVVQHVHNDRFVLLADMPSNTPTFQDVFDHAESRWVSILDSRGFLFFQRTTGS